MHVFRVGHRDGSEKTRSEVLVVLWGHDVTLVSTFVCLLVVVVASRCFKVKFMVVEVKILVILKILRRILEKILFQKFGVRWRLLLKKASVTKILQGFVVRWRLLFKNEASTNVFCNAQR